MGGLSSGIGAVRRIAVFRALMLGDLLCAVPALRALRAGWPQASITLVGLPWAREWAARLSCVDDFVAFPGWPGLPEAACDLAAIPAFLERMQARHLDLALQLHGSGGIVNPIVAAFGARHSAGFAAPGVWCPAADAALYRDWPRDGHEIERLLALTDHLGLARRGLGLEFPLVDADRQALHALWPAASSSAPYVCVHAGAQLPSRRWGAARFAAVADALAARGHRIVLTGTAAEAPLVAEVRRLMRADAVDLGGRTTLWTLGALVEGAAAVVCNDTGISHVAAALGTPSVVVSAGADVKRWAPLDADRHHVIAHDLPCRPCAFAECPHAGHPCARAVEVEAVLAAFPAMCTKRACRLPDDSLTSTASFR